MGAHARRHGRRGALLGLLDAARRRRRPHPRGLPLPGGRAAAHGRLHRGRDQGDQRLHRARRAREHAGRDAPPRGRRGAARAGDGGGARVDRRPARVRARDAQGARTRRSSGPGPDRYPDLYGGEAPRSPSRSPSPSRSSSCPEPDEEPAPGRGSGEGRGGRHALDRPRRPHAPGPLPRVGHRVARLRSGPSRTPASSSAPAATRCAPTPPARRRPPPSWSRRSTTSGPGEGDRHGRRPAHHALRAAPGARHQGRQGRPAQGRPRLRAGRRRHPHPRPDPRQAGGRRRGPQRPPAHRAPRRRLPGAARRLVAAHRLAGQGRRGPRDRRRPGQDAAPAGRGHHRRGQVRRRQRDALLDPAARHAARGPDGARRPQAGRAQPLRLDPAPADAGHHLAAPGRHRAAEPRARDGAALLVHVARPHPLADRAQQGPRDARRAAAARTSCA